MESTNGIAQSQDVQVSQPSVTSTQPAQAAPATEERSFRQSEVNEIVKKAKYGAVEDYKRLSSERPDYTQQKYNDTTSQQPSHQNTQPAAHVPNESDFRRMAAEEASRMRDEWLNEARSKSEAEQGQRIVQNFWNKIAPGKEKYEDFEAVTGDIEYARFPNVVQLLAEYIDNSHDVLYQLGNDRIKMANLEQLAQMSPKDAIVQAKRLSQSIKDNEAASKMRTPNAPIRPLRPSNTGTDSGHLSIRDLRAKYKA